MDLHKYQIINPAECSGLTLIRALAIGIPKRAHDTFLPTLCGILQFFGDVRREVFLF